MKNKSLQAKYLINFDNYISKKDINTLLLISFIAILPSILTGYNTSNLWERFIIVLQNPLANFLFFLEVLIIILNIKKHICYNELFYMRFSSIKGAIKSGLRATLIAVLSFYLIFSLFVLAGSSFFALENYSFTMYEKYNIQIYIYILFLLFKNITIYILISSLIYLGSFIIRKNFFKYILLFIQLVLYFIPYKKLKVKYLYQVPIFFQNYLLGINCQSFFFEIGLTLFYIFIILILCFILYKISIKRKVL